MPAQLAETHLIDGLPANQLLDGLARVYRWLLVLDSGKRLLWMSDGVAALFGDDAPEIGDDMRRFIAELPRPDQVFSLRSEFRGRGHVAGVPLELRTRDGDRIDADVTVTRIDTDDPDRWMLLAVVRPVGQEDHARPGGSVAASLLDHAREPILAVDAHGFILHANPAAVALTGRRREQLEGYPAALLFGSNASSIERLAARFDDMEGGCTVQLQRPDDTQLEVEVSVVPIGEGRRGVYLRQVEEPGDAADDELRRTNDELEHCVNSLAHDLRSPLVALLGFSRLLRQEYATLLDNTGHHFLDRIEQAGRTMESLVHDLLELSRIGQAGDRPSLVDPRGVLLQLRAELKPRLEEGGIELVLPDGPPLVFCDRTRLYQLFSNLIGNAIGHMGSRDGARIEVSIEACEGGHRISVSDNGRGIDAAKREQIFEAFQSFPQEGGRRGTGMGLAIVKKIAEKLGGRVWLDSAPGEGATFHVLLPAA